MKEKNRRWESMFFGELLENVEMAKKKAFHTASCGGTLNIHSLILIPCIAQISMKRLRIQHVVLRDVAENQSLKKSSSLISSPFSLDHEDQTAYERDNCK